MDQSPLQNFDRPAFVVMHVMLLAHVFNTIRDLTKSVPRRSGKTVVFNVEIQTPVPEIKPDGVDDIDVCQHLLAVPVGDDLVSVVELLRVVIGQELDVKDSLKGLGPEVEEDELFPRGY